MRGPVMLPSMGVKRELSTGNSIPRTVSEPSMCYVNKPTLEQQGEMKTKGIFT